MELVSGVPSACVEPSVGLEHLEPTPAVLSVKDPLRPIARLRPVPALISKRRSPRREAVRGKSYFPPNLRPEKKIILMCVFEMGLLQKYHFFP